VGNSEILESRRYLLNEVRFFCATDKQREPVVGPFPPLRFPRQERTGAHPVRKNKERIKKKFSRAGAPEGKLRGEWVRPYGTLRCGTWPGGCKQRNGKDERHA